MSAFDRVMEWFVVGRALKELLPKISFQSPFWQVKAVPLVLSLQAQN